MQTTPTVIAATACTNAKREKVIATQMTSATETWFVEVTTVAMDTIQALIAVTNLNRLCIQCIEI